METVELVLALMACCILLALVARRAKLPYAVILVLGGMALAFTPGLPRVELDPGLALAFFLPPLLQGSAYSTDWRAFRADLRPILLLAVGCVMFTAFAIGLLAKLLVPEMPWAAAIALGAIVAPPDAVAAAAVLQRLHLPRRIVTVLEGESLINDASALVLYKLAIAAAAAGALAPHQAVLQFFALAVGGVAIGWAVGRAAVWLIPRLNDTVLETVLSFVACYAAYLGAEAVHVSGVMAVVTTGAVLGRAQHEVFTSRTRLEARTVWQFIQFVLNSLIFILIGLQLNEVLGRLDGHGEAPWLATLGVAISLALVVSRFVWVFPTSAITKPQGATKRWRTLTIISWCGMRGVVSLAAALALPLDFPYRDLIVFLAFCAILATLVVQGTTLEWLIRGLKVEQKPHASGVDPEEAEGRRVAAQAALEEIERWLDDPLEGAIAADIVSEFRDRAGHLHRTARAEGAAVAERAARRRLRLLSLEASRAALIAHHATGALHEEALARLETELDMEELRIRQVLGDERTEAEKLRDEARRRKASLAPLFG